MSILDSWVEGFLKGKKNKPQGCKGKTPYSQKKAKRIAAKRERETGLVFVFYKCSFCYRWHIGRIIREIHGMRVSEKSTLKLGKEPKEKLRKKLRKESNEP